MNCRVCVCVWIIHPSIPQTLLFLHTCGSPPLCVTKSLVPHLPPFLVSSHPLWWATDIWPSPNLPVLCRNCFLSVQKKIKIDSLWRFAQYHFSLLAIWSAVVWKELINNTVDFLLFMFNFSCTFIDFLPFLCLVDPHFSLFHFLPIFCHSY